LFFFSPDLFCSLSFLFLFPVQSKVTQEAQMAYEGLVESPSADVSQVSPRNSVDSASPIGLLQLMVTNPLRILRSGQVPVINPRTRSASVASTLPPKIHESVRNSVPENLNGTKIGVPPQ
jgi:hypothetical protein